MSRMTTSLMSNIDSESDRVKSIIIKHVLLAEAQHRRLRSAFVWVRQNCLVLVIS